MKRPLQLQTKTIEVSPQRVAAEVVAEAVVVVVVVAVVAAVQVLTLAFKDAEAVQRDKGVEARESEEVSVSPLNRAMSSSFYTRKRP